MNEPDQLYQRLKNADPAAHIDTDPDSAHGRRLKARVLAHTAQRPAARRAPRKSVVALAAAIITMIGSVAVATGVFDPDPEQVASILDQAEEENRAAVHTQDWRPNLRTEQIWCAYDDGVVGSTRTFAFDLDEPMTEQHLIRACNDGPDEHAGHDKPNEFTICEAHAPADEVRRSMDMTGRWEGSGDEQASRWKTVSGELTTDRPGFPVVLGWDAHCPEVSLDTNAPAVQLGSWESTAAVNQARQIEIALTSAAYDQCLSLDEARTMAAEAQNQLQRDWLIGEPVGSMDCYRVWLDPQLGVLEIGPKR